MRRLFDALDEDDIGVTPDLLNAIGLHLSLEEAMIHPMMIGGDLDEIARESIIEHLGVKRLIAEWSARKTTCCRSWAASSTPSATWRCARR